jgi:hypothetical protein
VALERIDVPLNAASSAKKVPGLSSKTKWRKLSPTSGIAAAVLGRIWVGLARKAYSSGASKMPATSVREYRSVMPAGSKLVSATGKA